jgi:hypothetical protein
MAAGGTMTSRPIEFSVDGFVQGEHFTVLGRCGDESIDLGDEFDAIYHLKKRRYPDEVGDEPVREVEIPVRLRVVCIHAYLKSLPALGQGMTGSIAIEGAGLEYIAPGWVLGRREPLRGEGTLGRGNGDPTQA